MGATKPKPWAVIALALAGSALAFDQFVLSASADSVAAESSETAADPGAETSDTQDQSVSRRHATSLTLAERFEAFEREQRLAGVSAEQAFGTPESFKARPAAEPAQSEENPAAGLRLSSVLAQDGQDPMAVINGRPVRVGETIEGATVTEITARSVTVTTAIGPMVLELDRPGLAANRQDSAFPAQDP